MKTLGTIVLIAAIPVATFAGTVQVANDVDQARITTGADVRLKVGTELAVCTGRKCAGRGDSIRNGQGMDGTLRLSDNRGGQTNSGSSGSKKGPRG